MKGPYGAMILGGAALQVVALFINGTYYNSSIFKTLKLSGGSFVWNSSYLGGAIVCAVAAMAVITNNSRVAGALAVGAAIMAGLDWLPLMLPRYVYHGGHAIGTSGAVGVAGAGLAIFGGVLTWKSDVDAPAASYPAVRSQPLVARPATPTVPAGWYPNPSGAGQRWWDGAAWTEHTHP